MSSSVTVSKQEQRPDETRCRGSSTRVVVTGLGVITPIGIGKEAFWDNLVNGVSGIGPITRFDASDYPTRIAERSTTSTLRNS